MKCDIIEQAGIKYSPSIVQSFKLIYRIIVYQRTLNKKHCQISFLLLTENGNIWVWVIAVCLIAQFSHQRYIFFFICIVQDRWTRGEKSHAVFSIYYQREKNYSQMIVEQSSLLYTFWDYVDVQPHWSFFFDSWQQSLVPFFDSSMTWCNISSLMILSKS